MKRSTDRILTTHVGSLPRPGPLLDKMRAGERGEDLADTVAEAVTAAVRQQVAYGVDVVTDGEQGKTGFFAYADERLTGFKPRPGARADPWSAEVSAFPEYYAGYFARAMTGGAVVALEPLVCTGPSPTGARRRSPARSRICAGPWSSSPTWRRSHLTPS